MAAVAEKIDTGEAIEPTPEQQIFFSKTQNLRLVRYPMVRTESAVGTQTTISPGLRYEFEGGYLRVDDKLRKKTEQFVKRYGAHYDEGEDALSVEDWLRDHENFQSEGPGGFVELKSSVPDSAPVLSQITDLLLAGDTPALEALIEEERENHQRADVLETGQKVLERLYALEEAAKAAPPEPPATG